MKRAFPALAALIGICRHTGESGSALRPPLGGGYKITTRAQMRRGKKLGCLTSEDVIESRHQPLPEPRAEPSPPAWSNWSAGPAWLLSRLVRFDREPQYDCQLDDLR